MIVRRGLIRFDEVAPIARPGDTPIWGPDLCRERWPLRRGRPGRSARRLVLSGLLIFLSVLAGCAITDEGAISYRVAETLPTKERETRASDIRGQAIVLTTSNDNRLTDPIMPLTLVRQELEMPSQAIRNGNSIAIRLRHVYVNDCSAFPLNPQRVLSNFAIARPNCEEAILANAFEMTKGKSFPVGPAAKNEARIVFFSTDVEGGNAMGAQGQSLNLANLPIYGPITYNGGPMALVLYLIEVDAETPQIKALLSSLASLGSIVYPPASPALGILNKVGGALLEGEQDDTDFAFSLQLDSYPELGDAGQGSVGAGPSQGHAWLEEGNYVFIREQDRQKVTPWADLVFDDNTGKVFRTISSADGRSILREEYKDNTYLVIQILKGLPSKDIDQQQVLFSDFRADLQTRAKAEAATIQAAAEAVANDLTHIANFDAARRALNSIEKYCARKRQGEEVNDADANRSVFDLVGLVAASAPKEGGGEPSLAPEQAQILLRRMRLVANATSESDLQLFTSPVSWTAQGKARVSERMLKCGSP